MAADVMLLEAIIWSCVLAALMLLVRECRTRGLTS
jgi:hypothetical protein